MLSRSQFGDDEDKPSLGEQRFVSKMCACIQQDSFKSQDDAPVITDNWQVKQATLNVAVDLPNDWSLLIRIRYFAAVAQSSQQRRQVGQRADWYGGLNVRYAGGKQTSGNTLSADETAKREDKALPLCLVAPSCGDVSFVQRDITVITSADSRKNGYGQSRKSGNMVA